MNITDSLTNLDLQRLNQLSNKDVTYNEVCVGKKPIVDAQPFLYNYTADADIYLASKDPNRPENPMPNTNYFVKKQKSKNLLLCFGESWTYGDSLTGVSAKVKQDNFRYRIEHVFACHMARILNCDYYVSAVPGDAMHNYTVDLAKTIACFKDFLYTYDNIYIVYQFTDYSRCNFIHHHPLENMYKHCKDHIDIQHEDRFFQEKPIQEFLKEGNTIKDFCTNAEKNYMYFLQRIIKNIPVKHKVICWQNFYHWHQVYNVENIHIVSTPWMHYTNLIEGEGYKSVEMPYWMNKMAIMDFYNTYMKKGYFDKKTYKTIKNEMMYLTKIYEENWQPILDKGRWHLYHPSELYHFMWALYMLNDSGWLCDSENL